MIAQMAVVTVVFVVPNTFFIVYTLCCSPGPLLQSIRSSAVSRAAAAAAAVLMVMRAIANHCHASSPQLYFLGSIFNSRRLAQAAAYCCSSPLADHVVCSSATAAVTGNSSNSSTASTTALEAKILHHQQQNKQQQPHAAGINVVLHQFLRPFRLDSTCNIAASAYQQARSTVLQQLPLLGHAVHLSLMDLPHAISSSPAHTAHHLSTSSSNSRGSIPPQVLTARLKSASTADKLVQLVQQHAAEMNHIHISAAYTQAVTLCRNSVLPQQQPAAVKQLLLQLHLLAGQLQQQCRARELANIIWSCGRLRCADTAAVLLPVFLQDSNLQQAEPQHVANVLWAAATLKLLLTPEQAQALLLRFSAVLQAAKPQGVSSTLWALATLQQQGRAQLAIQQMRSDQLQQLLQRFQELLPQANPQAIANTLWAFATMQQQVPADIMQQMLQRFGVVLAQARPQAIANTLWACGQLHYIPLQLLSALEQHPQQLLAVLAAATPQELANMAWACGQLGYRGKRLPGALLQQAVKLLQDKGRGGFTIQGLCNLCWAAAVLDMQQEVSQVLLLVAASTELWETAIQEAKQQLYQVHLWLLDSQLPVPGQGLSGVLSQQQLEQCRASWEQAIASGVKRRRSDLQQSVLNAVQQLPVVWQQQPATEQYTADGMLVIDIAATTAAGVQVAIEVDGPTHFLQPGNLPTGPTQRRNRALTARGYVVVSIPYWEWDALRDAGHKQEYMLAKLQPVTSGIAS